MENFELPMPNSGFWQSGVWDWLSSMYLSGILNSESAILNPQYSHRTKASMAAYFGKPSLS
jgi:hypothetical protein